MAITSITIENFKGIGDAVTIPIRPITLLFGKNSSGKSTVLQALLYMLNVIIHREPDPYHLGRLGMDADLMDLGGFRAFVYRHELDRKIRIRVEFDVAKLPAQTTSEKIECDAQLGWIEIKTGWNLEKNNAYIDSQTIGVGDEKWEYTDVPEKSDEERMNYLIYSCGEELKGIRYLGPIRKIPSRGLKEIRYALLSDDGEFKKFNDFATGQTD